jgi:two-component system invasion response regulator UvrY
MACKRPPVRIRYSPQNCSPAMGLLMFYTYIIYSAKIDRYYIGSCEDIKLRLLQHNSGRNLSTKAGGHWELKYTETFETLLKEAYPFAEIIDVDNATSLIDALREGNCDIVICDISMPPADSGLVAISRISEEFPLVPILGLSMHSAEQYAVRVLKAGAWGFLHKDAAAAELIKAVDHIRSGRKYLNETVASVMADSIGNAPATDLDVLSKRERSVFELLSCGKSVTEIAESFSLSTNTIRSFRNRIFDKMGFSSNTELVRFALTYKMAS